MFTGSANHVAVQQKVSPRDAMTVVLSVETVMAGSILLRVGTLYS